MVAMMMFVVAPCLCIWAIHAYMENPTAAAVGTWLMLPFVGALKMKEAKEKQGQ